MTPLSPDEVKSSPIAKVRQSYNKLAEQFNKILDYETVFCPRCANFMARNAFYMDKNNKSGLACYCKRCIQAMACDYNKAEDRYVDNKEKAIETLRFLNKPFINTLYEKCVRDIQENLAEKNRSTAWGHYYTQIASLPQYNRKTFEHSEFPMDDDANPDFELKENKKTIKAAKKRFGDFYTNQELMFLENEYQDWVSRYECNTKAQETIFERLACKKLEINKATKVGDNTKDLDKTYQDLLSTANITPRQSIVDPVANAQTLGTLIQRWEETDPIPEVDPDLEDIDHLGLIVDALFRGHTAKAVGLKNRFTSIYEKFMKRYTVSKPEYEEDEDSEAIFEKIFGTLEEE